MKLEFIGLLK